MRTVRFVTFGCKVNQYDTQQMRQAFIRGGFSDAPDAETASVCVVNTCTVTARADAESLAAIRRLRRENPRCLLLVTGCLAELDRRRIRGSDRRARIFMNGEKARALDFATSRKSPSAPVRVQPLSSFAGRTRAFLKIQDGCDNFCSYCKVALVRGKPRSKPLAQVRAEARRLAQAGYQEIVLTGICLGKYGKDLRSGETLAAALAQLELIPGIKRIRLSSIEMSDVNEELIRRMRLSRKCCRHLHIPLQSGDDGVLRRMNRPYTAEEFCARIRRLRQALPAVSITTDCLVGFPGETQEAFLNSCAVIQEILPLKVHIFPYSRRERTKAAALHREEIKGHVLKERLEEMRRVSERCARAVCGSFLGTEQKVLFERPSSGRNGYWEGYSGNYLRVRVRSCRSLENKLRRVRLMRLEDDCIEAELC